MAVHELHLHVAFLLSAAGIEVKRKRCEKTQHVRTDYVTVLRPFVFPQNSFGRLWEAYISLTCGHVAIPCEYTCPVELVAHREVVMHYNGPMEKSEDL
jgi:hypothetical protein